MTHRTGPLGDKYKVWRVSPTVRIVATTSIGGVQLPVSFKVIERVDAPGARERIVSRHRLLTAARKAALRHARHA